MLHFKILQGLHPLGHGLLMPWTNWGEGLPLPLPFASQNTIDEGHNAKSLQANLQLEKFVLANQQTGTVFKSPRCKIGAPRTGFSLLSEIFSGGILCVTEGCYHLVMNVYRLSCIEETALRDVSEGVNSPPSTRGNFGHCDRFHWFWYSPSNISMATETLWWEDYQKEAVKLFHS